MHRLLRLYAFGALFALLAVQSPAYAARPLLDYHRLDSSFELYAGDTSVPWRDATVRLDTYTSAPVEFAVYRSDVAAVIRAGANTRPRAIDTARLRPLARWRYTPPGGYRFQTNDVQVPLGRREGFFVVEARRGSVGEQVWINRTRIGLLSKESPAGLLLYGADLGTGEPLARMRVSFIVHDRFVDRYTDRFGLLAWNAGARPVFALARWGSSVAFLSFLPQPPLPRTIVAVRTDTAVVHAGGRIRLAGFVRMRSGARLRAASGTASILLRSPDGAVAQTVARLDAAGAFAAVLYVPPSAAAGNYTVMVSSGGGVAGTQLHVDANAGGLSLAVAAACARACAPGSDLPILVTASRGGKPAGNVGVDVRVIRSPHAYAGARAETAWGVAQWYRARARTDSSGRAMVEIPHPTDGLPSTYGVRASSGGATAETRVVVPSGPVTLRIHLERDDIGSGMPARFDVYQNDASTGKPQPGGGVRVQIVHGTSVQEQHLTFDSSGVARGAFTAPETGSNLVIASIEDGRVMDATQLQVEPQTMQSAGSQSQRIAIALDRDRYTSGEIAHVRAALAGAQGSAVLTFESAGRTLARVAPASGGSARADFRVGAAAGAIAAGAAFVRDGSLAWDTVPVSVDAPGRPLSAPLLFDKRVYVPGAVATLHLAGVQSGTGTLVIRVSKSDPTGAALFESAPQLLAVGSTATQSTAASQASWHPWVDSTGAHPLMQTFARRSAPPADLTMMQADSGSVYWKVDRHAGDALQLAVPQEPGKYVVSLLKIDDDGRVAAAAADLVVQ